MSEHTHTHTHISKGQKNRKSAILLIANCKTESCNPTFKEVTFKEVTKGIRNNLKIKTIGT
jgi:hypothetical protein